ncbi:MAG: hypothetical protein A2V93_11770 [Ignavibacteria bacterium RBG_16_34_14]|nr:MAG: hypothetical protein A2V93_11770 [Ignavibacteria bacterium RBG_16_34_14]
MHNKFVSIKEALNTNPELSNIRNIVKQSEVVEKFFSVFPEMEKVVTPVRVNKKVLMLKVESSVLRSELKFNESLMVETINKFFNEERVRSVRFAS